MESNIYQDIASRTEGDIYIGERVTQGLTSPPPTALFRAALYARLSVEDERRRESRSIENQLALLEETARREGLTVVDRYVDRGCSGANFERPGFVRMMEDLRAGKVNCVVVKDLSRIGRNYIETGHTLERVFPALGVRFLAVNEGIDTLREPDGAGTLNVQVRNLVNDLYARDISRKVTSQLELKRRKGEFVGAVVPYGYRRSPEDRHRLILDPVTAPVVRELFAWREQGCTPGEITKRLNARGEPPPARVLYEQGVFRHPKYAAAVCWHKSTVARLLANPVYQGHMAQGRQRTSLFLHKRRVCLPPEEWTVVEHTQDALAPSTLVMGRKTAD